MTTRERSPTSGLGFLAATLLFTSTSATAEDMIDTTASRVLAWWTSGSSSQPLVRPATLVLPLLRHASTGGDLDADIVDFRRTGKTGAGALGGLESLPERIVTNLASARIAGEHAALLGLYQRLTATAGERGCRVTRFVLAGEDLADSPSEDVILEVYVEGFNDNEARLDLWEALSAEVEDAASSPLLSERLALVVHGTTV
jgi:hypothetical protein